VLGRSKAKARSDLLLGAELRFFLSNPVSNFNNARMKKENEKKRKEKKRKRRNSFCLNLLKGWRDRT
jgi:hypothetical protein